VKLLQIKRTCCNGIREIRKLSILLKHFPFENRSFEARCFETNLDAKMVLDCCCLHSQWHSYLILTNSVSLEGIRILVSLFYHIFLIKMVSDSELLICVMRAKSTCSYLYSK